MAAERDDRSPAQDGDLSRGETVYRHLREAMWSGKLRSGDRLREEEVARTLGVSRTPVREALGRLLTKGLVEASSGRGLVVRSLSSSEVVELYAMREIIEGAAAHLAAQHASRPEVDALSDLSAEFRACLGAPAEMAAINRRFHDAIHRAARNRYLDAASKELQDAIALLGSTTFTVSGRPTDAADEHDQILLAIGQRDSDTAERLARAHIREALRARLKILPRS